MIPLINQAVLIGYSAKQILNYLSNKIPALKQGISNARSAGFEEDKILKYLSNKIPINKDRAEEQYSLNDRYLANAGIKNKAERDATRNKFLKGALGVGAGILAYTQLPKRIAGMANTLLPNRGNAPVNPNAPQAGNPPLTGQPQQPTNPQAPVNPNQPIQPPQTPNNPIQPPQNLIKQAKQSTQQNPINQPISPQLPNQIHGAVPTGDILWNNLSKGKTKGVNPDTDAFLRIAKHMQTSGEIKNKEEFDNFYNLFSQKKQQGKDLVASLRESIQEYSSSKLNKGQENGAQPPSNQPINETQPLQEAKIEPEGNRPIESQNANTGQKIEAPKESKKEVGHVVELPDGKIGTIESIKPDHAVVDIEGKKRPVKLDQLEPEPDEVRNAKIEFDIDSVPEDLRSGPLNEVYLPSHQQHVTIKYNSNSGTEKDKRYLFYRRDGGKIDPAIIEKLRNGSQLPVTDGNSFWGGWNRKTADSRGTAAYHELSSLAQKEWAVDKQGNPIPDDPKKPYLFIEEEEVYTHGYRKGYEKTLKEKEKEYNEKQKSLKPKKPKKKRT